MALSVVDVLCGVLAELVPQNNHAAHGFEIISNCFFPRYQGQVDTIPSMASEQCAYVCVSVRVNRVRSISCSRAGVISAFAGSVETGYMSFGV